MNSLRIEIMLLVPVADGLVRSVTTMRSVTIVDEVMEGVARKVEAV